ncbi:MAG: hypothetical protein P8Z78_11035 [Gammaproteobacteria bacterium]|jgi:hypothetical protein
MINPLKALVAAAVIAVSPVANPDNPENRREMALASVEMLINLLDDSSSAAKESMEVLEECRAGGELHGQPFCTRAKIALRRLEASMQKVFYSCELPALQDDREVNVKCDELVEQWQPFEEIIDQI